jgi:hypothetical protein
MCGDSARSWITTSSAASMKDEVSSCEHCMSSGAAPQGPVFACAFHSRALGVSSVLEPEWSFYLIEP